LKIDSTFLHTISTSQENKFNTPKSNQHFFSIHLSPGAGGAAAACSNSGRGGGGGAW